MNGDADVHFGSWCDKHGGKIEDLYGTELHYRGTMLPDLGQVAIAREDLAVLRREEIGAPQYTVDGWLNNNELSVSDKVG
jgi:hypothetical protein